MKISRPTKTTNRERARISATISWEDSDRSDREIYFETDVRYADDLTPTPHAFLLAAAIPAMRFGERRVLVEGQVCPQLRLGLFVAMQQLHNWYGITHPPVSVEATDGFRPSPPAATPRTASCMSGGIDSLATFRQNRIDLPLDHPGSIKDVIFIYGFDMGGHADWRQNTESFDRARQSLSETLAAADATLIPVYSNMRMLEEGARGIYYTDLFVLQSHGACLAAIAHTLSRRVTQLLVPATHDVKDLEPFGSHPLLDPNYSSSALAVRYDGLAYSRCDKVRLITQWPAGRNVLRVCADPIRSAETVNCGKCEKCLRTMVSFLVLGELERCPTFPQKDVSPADIETLRWTEQGTKGSAFAYLSQGSRLFWQELVAPLRQVNRHDLADVVCEKLAVYDRMLARSRWLSRIYRLDRAVLGGTLHRIYCAARDRRLRKPQASSRVTTD